MCNFFGLFVLCFLVVVTCQFGFGSYASSFVAILKYMAICNFFGLFVLCFLVVIT